MLRTERILLTVALIAGLASSAAAVRLKDGDLVVAGLWAVYAVDPESGDRTLLSSDTVGQGPAFEHLDAVLVESRDSVLAVDGFAPAILRIDLATGNRAVVSSPEVGTGPFVWPRAIVREASGHLLVADYGGALLRVDPTSGDRSIVSSASIGTGPTPSGPKAIALAADETVLLADAQLFALFRVDRLTGNRTVISSTAVGSGPALWHSRGIAELASGELVTLGGQWGTAYLPHVMRVSPETGNREILSSLERGAGPRLGTPEDLTLDASGGILVADEGWDAIFRVDPLSGDRELVSSSGPLGLVGEGPSFTFPRAVVVASLPLWVVLDIAIHSTRNVITANGMGGVAVALLGAPDFDATQVDFESVAFGPGGAAPLRSGADPYQDVNGDGRVDLVQRFHLPETGIAFGQSEACLTGTTLDGSPFEGCDAVLVSDPYACGHAYQAAVIPPLAAFLGRRSRRRLRR